MPLTAEQIAQKVGLSSATVSRVLNNSHRVSEAARKAVHEKGEMPRFLGRRPKKIVGVKAARSYTGLVEILMVRRTQMERIEVRNESFEVGPIGSYTIDRFFSPAGRLGNSFYRHIMDGAIGELKRYQHRAVFQVTSNLSAPHLLAEINDEKNHGLLILGECCEETRAFMKKCRCPVVSFLTWEHQSETDYVGIDNISGISQAFDHLWKLGHRRIGYVAGDQQIGVCRERYSAYRLKLADVGLPLRKEWVSDSKNHLANIQEDVERMLRMEERPTAIMGFYDGSTLAVKLAADRVGLKIPEELSVVGFDDEEVAGLFSPALTTIRVPTQQMGQQAVQLLMMRLQMGRVTPGEGWSIRAKPTLIVRESTAAPCKEACKVSAAE